jgi:hypothetical protein
VPRALPLIATLVALPLLLPAFVLRLTREHRDRPDAVSAEQMLVFRGGTWRLVDRRSMMQGGFRVKAIRR